MVQGRKTTLTIRLTAEECQMLRLWQRSTTLPAGRAKRARIFLLLADGVPISDIADIVGTTRHSIYKWAERFLKEGLEGLADKPGRSRQPGGRQEETG